ncbi:hypothetical protein PIB30_104249, partial [Stylosanthes scabra]|nr:hypothetical protein [Stylosanthes scabra]
MGDRYVVPVFHHGKSLVRHPNGELVYANGAVERFDDVEIDIDTINLGDFVKLLESIGYRLNVDEIEFHIYVEHDINKPLLAKKGGGANIETVNLDDRSCESVGVAGGIIFKTPIIGSDSSSDIEINDSHLRGKRKATNEKCDDGKGKRKVKEDIVKVKSLRKDFNRKKCSSRGNGEKNNVAGPSVDNGSVPDKNG